ncbi:MAG: AMP-binding protein, partial [Deltaproteobacteria bacterium]|nr:AMP-binding protein [Deltaproteobacteria bacterium]
MNIANNLNRSAFYFPDRPAIIEDGKEITYARFSLDSDRVAAGLARLGLRPGELAAICMSSGYCWLAVYFGILKAGGVAVTLSNALTDRELALALRDARPGVLFTDEGRLEEIGRRDDFPFLTTVVSPGGDIDYDGLLDLASGRFSCIDRDRGDTAAVLFTGGTTGTPKGAMLTHENIMTSACNVSHNERSTPEDRVLCFLPLNHVFGQIHIANATIYSGGCIVMLPAFDPDRALHAVGAHGVTKLYAVPTIYVRLLQLTSLKDKLGSLRYCFSAAASMAAELVREWKDRLALDIHEAYGMTESASMVTYNHYYRHVVGSVGTTVGSIEVRISDPDGNMLGPGEEGEICIKGPNIMKGYLNRAEETREAFRDGWFRSGDIGVMGDDGYLYMVDRIKDMIITGGENVYPREIEELLYTRPEVQECTVIGLPDKEYGERVTAFIIPGEGRQLDPDVLKLFLKERLSPYKVPKAFIAVADLPRSPAGKILKRELKKAEAERQN